MHLYLSPHADDAVLSCGAQIAMLRRRAERVVIWTLMSGYPDNAAQAFPLAQHFRALWAISGSVTDVRRREDAAAAAYLGAEIHFGDWVECIYRSLDGVSPLYQEAKAINDVVDPADPLLTQLDPSHIHRMLQPFALKAGDMIHVPLGVGAHVDHQIVRQFALKAQQLYPELEFIFYEEYPYVVWGEEATQRAVASIVSPVRRVPVRTDFRARLHKIRAIACYGSQLRMIWPTGMLGMAVRTWQYMGRRGEADWVLM